jgi:hypothetical protein
MRTSLIVRCRYLTALLVFAAISTTAVAQSSADVSATAFADIPADAVLEVRAGRDLPLERDLVDEVSKRLIARGYVVAHRGSIVVTVEGTAPVPGVAMANPNSGEDGFRVLNTPKGNSAVQVPFNRDEAKPSAAIFTLRMSAYRPGQSNLWVGSASGPDNGGGRRATTFALAQALIAVFGRSTARPDAE